MELKLLAQFTRKQKFVDFFVQDVEALGELEGLTNLISKDITNEFLNDHPYAYITLPNIDTAKRILDRSVLIKSFNLVFGEGQTLDKVLEAANKELVNKFMTEHAGSIAFRIEITNRSTDTNQYKKQIGDFINTFELTTRKIDLHNPDIVLKLVEVYKYGDKGSSIKAYFVAEILKNPCSYAKFALPDRAYIGPTTTDHELAILMANQALVREGSYVYDPFCGTCGLLLICTNYG
jgi:tRNA (guanine10-N2)-methyltransferase